MAPSHELALFLEAQGVGTVGVDIFTNEEPTAPDAVLTVYDTGGSSPVLYAEQLREPTVQVRTRGNDYSSANDLQQAAFEALNNVINQQLGDHRYLGVWLIGEVTSIGKDGNSRTRLTSNYRIERHPL